MDSHNQAPNERKLSLLEVLTLQDLTPGERAAEADARDHGVKRATLYFAGVLLLTSLVSAAAPDQEEAPHPQPAVEAPAPLHGQLSEDNEIGTAGVAAEDTSTTVGSQVMRTSSEQDGNFMGDPVTAILNSVISTLR